MKRQHNMMIAAIIALSAVVVATLGIDFSEGIGPKAKRAILDGPTPGKTRSEPPRISPDLPANRPHLAPGNTPQSVEKRAESTHEDLTARTSSKNTGKSSRHEKLSEERTRVAPGAAVHRFQELVQQALESGMSLPLVFQERPENTPFNGAEHAVLGEIVEEFIRDLEPLAGAEHENDFPLGMPEEIWEEARTHADGRYRLLFGIDAYNTTSVQSNREAFRFE